MTNMELRWKLVVRRLPLLILLQCCLSHASICTGGQFTCAILDNHELKCWGDGSHGVLGSGSVDNIGDEEKEIQTGFLPLELGKGQTPVQVSCGVKHACAVLLEGSVKCWGKGSSGQTGQGSRKDIGDRPEEMGDQLKEIDLGICEDNAVESVCSGEAFSCALVTNGEVKCWGNNQFGQLGAASEEVFIGDQAGEMGEDLAAVEFGVGLTALQITCGHSHACAILNSGSVKCWGEGESGQLGTGSTHDIGSEKEEMGDMLLSVALGKGSKAVQISAGDAYTCALLENMQVKCWGENSSGQLGIGTPNGVGTAKSHMGKALVTVDLGLNISVEQISTGKKHACALITNGEVKCWGQRGALGASQNLGNVGDEGDEMGDALAAVSLGSNLTAIRVSCGDDHTCAVLKTGRVKCWGGGGAGQLGQGSAIPYGDGFMGNMGDDLRAINLGGLMSVPVSPSLSPTAAPTRLVAYPGAPTTGFPEPYIFPVVVVSAAAGIVGFTLCSYNRPCKTKPPDQVVSIDP